MSQHEMEQSEPAGGGLPRDLKMRIMSAALLASVALGLAYAGGGPFAMIVIVLAVIMSWEWGRLVRSDGVDAVFFVHAGAVALAGLVTSMGYAALALVALIAGAVAIVPLNFGERSRLSAFGVLYAGIPAVSLLWMRNDEPWGFAAVLLILLTVWATDTGAYFAGRGIGGPKLWPRVSPNKTWAGLIGGIVSAAVVGSIVAMALSETSVVALALTGALLGGVSQAGDLAESALKRRFGAKDTGHLIPGHGGVMDRLDGLVAAATLAALVAVAVNVHAPARALLLWK